MRMRLSIVPGCSVKRAGSHDDARDGVDVTDAQAQLASAFADDNRGSTRKERGIDVEHVR